MNASDPIQPMDFIDLKSKATEREYPVALLYAVPQLAYFLRAGFSKAACKEHRHG